MYRLRKAFIQDNLGVLSDAGPHSAAQKKKNRDACKNKPGGCVCMDVSSPAKWKDYALNQLAFQA
jgi:hypothetical protein